jgi:hypothetical protein
LRGMKTIEFVANFYKGYPMKPFLMQLKVIMFYTMMSTQDLSNLTGLSVHKINYILKVNKCSKTDATKVLEAFDMSLEDFFLFSPIIQ